MKLFNIKKLTAALSAVVLTVASSLSASVFADWKLIGAMGDLNNDQSLSVADLLLLSKHLVNQSPLDESNAYDVKGTYIGIGYSADYVYMEDYLHTADINQDNSVDVFDLILLRDLVISQSFTPVWQWEAETSTTTATTTSTTVSSQTTTTTTADPNGFISPPIYDLYGSLPSQNEARLLILYVDFPDCQFNYLPSTDQINQIAFGEANTNDSNYPFESMSAFYGRSSKGAVHLTGDSYHYTTQYNKSTYEGDKWHKLLVNEIIEQMDSQIDFSDFDGDGDKTVDAILISVPTEAGDTDWWPAAGIFGGDTYNRADGMNLGHVIVGNSQIESAENYRGFNKTYLHEMGHCMGLPDYYLYNSTDEDSESMRGSAGYELMDEAFADFGALSKLMLGWYKSDQISVYDSSAGSQTFTLTDDESNNGNCVIIPCGELDDNNYSEFFIIEYASLNGNNSYLDDYFWWRKTGSGVRVYHAEASVKSDYWDAYWRYASGEDQETNYNAGRRFIRLVGNATHDTDNFFHSGDIIDSSINGFNWYDSSGNMTIDPGVTITVGQMSGDSYEITISPK